MRREKDDEKATSAGGTSHVLLRLLGSASYRAAVYVYVYRGSFQPGARWGEGGRELTRDPSPVLNLFRSHRVHLLALIASSVVRHTSETSRSGRESKNCFARLRRTSCVCMYV